MKNFLDNCLMFPDETTQDGRDEFRRYIANCEGYDPDDAASMAQFHQDQEAEWEDRGVGDPGLLGDRQCALHTFGASIDDPKEPQSFLD